jgi:chromosome segregation ATPase
LSDIDAVDIRREIASILIREDSPSPHSEELSKLAEFDENLSSIAVDVVDLQEALTRLRGESDEVERLLDERRADLTESELARAQLADDFESARHDRAEAQVSLAAAVSQANGLRLEIASLEQQLSQREDELAEGELARARMADDCAREHEGLLNAEASLADANEQLRAREEQATALDDELRLLRARVEETETSAQESPASEHSVHLLLIPHRAGYELRESPGPPPEAGAGIEVDSVRFSVTRVRRSPLPGDTRRCAFLFPAADEDFSPGEKVS